MSVDLPHRIDAIQVNGSSSKLPFYERLRKIVNIPIAQIINTARYNLAVNKAHISLETQIRSTAKHESGHILLQLLNEQPIFDVYVSHLRREITKILGIPAGAIGTTPEKRPLPLILLEQTKIFQALRFLISGKTEAVPEETNFEDSIKEIFMLLAGATATDQDPEFTPLRKLQKDFSVLGETGDLAYAEEILSPHIAIENSNTDLIFSRFTKKLREFLDDPEVREIISVLAAYFRVSRYIRDGQNDVTPLILQELASCGITLDHIEQLRRRYLLMVKEMEGELRRDFEIKT